MVMHESRKFRQFRQGGPEIFFFGGGGGGISIFHRGSYGPPFRSNWTGPIASWRGSVPVFLRKSIATCDFWVGRLAPVPPLLPPSGSTHNGIMNVWPMEGQTEGRRMVRQAKSNMHLQLFQSWGGWGWHWNFYNIWCIICLKKCGFW